MTISLAAPRTHRMVVWLCGAVIVVCVGVLSTVLLLRTGGGPLWLLPGVVALAAVASLVMFSTRVLRAQSEDYMALRARFDAHKTVHDRFIAHIDAANDADLLPELPARPDNPDAQEEFDRFLNVMIGVREAYAAQRSAVHSSVVALSRKVQTTAHRVQEEAGRMVSRHPNDPDVLETSMRVDHAAAQQARYAQSLSTLCGEGPGQQWHEPLGLSDVVRGAAGRITAYQRVELSGDPGVAVSSRVVEPLIHLVAELLANAAQSSPPTTNVLVTLRHVQRGAVIEVDDCGVGMDDRRLDQARAIVSGQSVLDLFTLGELPQTGFAAVGTYVRTFGFRVDLTESVYGGVRATVLVPSELTEALPPASALTDPYLPLAGQNSGATIPSVPVVPEVPSVPEVSSAPPAPSGADTPRDPAVPMAGRKCGTIENDNTAERPAPASPEAGEPPNESSLPRRRSRRGEANASADQQRARYGTRAPQPSAEQAGQWMGAFLNTDSVDRATPSHSAGVGSHSDAYKNPEE